MKKVNTTTVNNYSRLMVAVGCMLMAGVASAAGGGLEAGTTEVNSIKTWLYTILGAGVFCYNIYNVIMALLEKKQWADVLVGLGYTAAAGGIIVAATWAWSIWGSN